MHCIISPRVIPHCFSRFFPGETPFYTFGFLGASEVYAAAARSYTYAFMCSMYITFTPLSPITHVESDVE